MIQRCEALSSHIKAGLFPARREEYGEDVRGRLELAETMALADYLGGIAAASGCAPAFIARLPRSTCCSRR